MRIRSLGDAAWCIDGLDAAPDRYVSAALRLPGVEDAWAASDTLAVAVRPGFDPARLTDLRPVAELTAKRHEIPVLYDGPDLAEVAALCDLSIEAVIALHAGQPYVCTAVGFCPGFGYLESLPHPLSSVSRRASPRPRVDPGSVALAAGKTAVYPLPRPGGWRLIGRTPLTLVDPEADYFPLATGDEVRFVPIDTATFEARRGERL